MNDYLFTSKRLGFRKWESRDLEPFSKMNGDPEVMEFFLRTWTVADTKSFMQRMNDHFDRHGFTFYAVDKLENRELVGMIGFKITGFKARFTPCVEIGWRIKKEEWNKGYATEGAKRCLSYGFEELNFSEVYSFTSLTNLKSERIMQKIGMRKTGVFEHPAIEEGHELRTHALYKITEQK